LVGHCDKCGRCDLGDIRAVALQVLLGDACRSRDLLDRKQGGRTADLEVAGEGGRHVDSMAAVTSFVICGAVDDPGRSGRKSQRQFIGITEYPYRQGGEREGMDHQQPTTAHTFGAGSEHTS